MGVFTHRTFSTEKPLHRTVFTHVFLHKKHLTQRKLYTQIAHRSFYRPTFLHAETSPGTGFTQQKIFRTQALTHKNKYSQQFLHTKILTQKVLRTEVLRTEGFTHSIAQHIFTYRRFYTDVFAQTQIAHRNLCTQHAFTHSQLLHRETLFPLLDHLPFVFPLSSKPSTNPK